MMPLLVVVSMLESILELSGIAELSIDIIVLGIIVEVLGIMVEVLGIMVEVAAAPFLVVAAAALAVVAEWAVVRPGFGVVALGAVAACELYRITLKLISTAIRRLGESIFVIKFLFLLLSEVDLLSMALRLLFIVKLPFLLTLCFSFLAFCVNSCH